MNHHPSRLGSPSRPPSRRIRWAVAFLAAALLVAPAAHAGLGFGEAHDGGFIGPMLGSSGTFTFRVSGYGAGDDADETGYARWDFQPWRAFTDRPKLSSGSQYDNFGLHGGYMPLDIGPLAFGAGFGFDFLTVGVPKLDNLDAGSYLLVPFGLEVLVGLRLWSWSRVLFSLQGQVVGGSDFEANGKRTGLTLEWFFAFGESGFYLLLAGETGSFDMGGQSFAAGQGLIGLTWWDF